MKTWGFQPLAWAHVHDDRWAVGLARVSLIECMVILVDLRCIEVHSNLFYSLLLLKLTNSDLNWSNIVFVFVSFLVCFCFFCMIKMIVLVVKNHQVDQVVSLTWGCFFWETFVTPTFFSPILSSECFNPQCLYILYILNKNNFFQDRQKPRIKTVFITPYTQACVLHFIYCDGWGCVEENVLLQLKTGNFPWTPPTPWRVPWQW